MKTRKNIFLPAVLSISLVLGIISCASDPPPARTGGDRPPSRVQDPQRVQPQDTQGILRRIAELCEKGDYASALGLFDKIDAKDAATDNVMLLKASVYLSAGEADKAGDIAGRIVSRTPQNTQALLILSGVEQARGSEKEQKSILERILKIEPDNVQALVALGTIAASASAFRTAAAFYDKALAAEEGNGEALIGRAWVYRNEKDPKNAERLLNQAVSLYPDWVTPVHERARLYKAAGFPREALADMDKARAMDGGDYWIAFDRGDVLVDLNRKQEALEEFERAKKINPDYFLAYVYTSGIKDEFGDYDGAEKDYAILTKLNPDYYFAFEGLGMHLMRKGNWNGARDAFMEAYKRAREDSAAYGLLAAMNWMRGGKISDPRQFLEQVMAREERNSLEWYMLRLYHDLSGDNDIVMKLDSEKNGDIKARMLYYLANYYDIRGNRTLADKYFLLVRELDRKSIPEWRLNEWALESRGLALK
ncbi:MAG: tetratricopeptide repeat protein [Treponema sp.]|nr:tetratricopeptide repeat protein [Treponema sp.]